MIVCFQNSQELFKNEFVLFPPNRSHLKIIFVSNWIKCSVLVDGSCIGKVENDLVSLL